MRCYTDGDGVAVLLPWATVAHFYAAYHMVKAALLMDPIFDDFKALKAVSQHLVPEDRYAYSHRARKGGSLGVNDVVKHLYGIRVYSTYLKLHEASVAVRYERGERLPTSADLQRLADEMDAHLREGRLRVGS